VRDKDGISAALMVTELAAKLKADGRDLDDELDAIAREHGLHLTDQLSVRVEDLDTISEIMQRLRGAPPVGLGGRAVESVEDLSDGVAGLPPTDALRYRLERGARVIVRPSGTEPKLKCYLEVIVPVGADGDVNAARVIAVAAIAAIKTDLAAAAGIQ
jgi:phosphomannomutase